MTGFLTPVDIANKALQTLRQPAIYSFSDNSAQSIECGRVYNQIRLAELRRCCWRFSTRRVILRPLGTTSLLYSPPVFDANTTYGAGEIVSFGNQIWVSTQDANSGNTPGDVPDSGVLFWDSYFGPLAVDTWNSPITPADSPTAGRTQPASYFDGELVYIADAGTATIYQSLVSDNTNDPTGTDPWRDDILYSHNDYATFNGTTYQSQVNFNFNQQPDTSPTYWQSSGGNGSKSWRTLSGSLTNLNITYPLGAGPLSDNRTRNAYRLPAGFLRQAPTDPKAGINPFLGAPTGNIMTDWLFESDYIVSRNADVIMLRFVADCQAVPSFDPLFAIALAERMAIELAPRLIDGDMLPILLGDAREEYSRTISEARAVNGIETGPVDPVEDEYLVCRL